MLKRCREADTTADTAELDPVFVDTNLGTHLAMLLCNSDTASDFKKKVATEHKKCFPEIGEIEVHSVMVKRRSNYYHLPDIMHVKSAFPGVKSNRFLSVDASKISTCLAVRNSLERGASSDVKNAVADPMTVKPLEKITDSHSSPYPEEHHVGTKSPARKKRKLRHTEDACHNSSLEDGNAMFRPNGIDEKPNMPDVKVSGERNDQYDVKGRLVSEGTSLPSMEEKFNVDSILNSQNLTSTNRTEEGNTLESMVDYGLGKDVLPLGAVSVTAPDSSARMMIAGGGGGDVSTTGSKRKKKGVKKTAAKIQDTTDTEQIGKEESIKPTNVEMEEVTGLLLDDDNKVIMPSNSKSPDHVGPDLALKEASHFQDAEKSNFSIVNSYKLKDSDERKEDNVVESKMDHELDQDVPTVHSSGVCINTADLSATIVDTGGGNGDVNSDGKKRKKKKKAQKSAKVKDTRDMEQIGDEVKKPQTETIRSEEKDESLKHDKVILPSESNYPDRVDLDLTQKEARVMRDSDAVMEPEISSCIKKKRERKRVGTNAENLGNKDIHKDIRGCLDLPSPSGYHISKATGKDENIKLNEGMDVEMKLLDASDHDAQEKVWELNRKEADSVQTQTAHTLENVSVGHKMMTEKTKSSVGDCHADSCTAETEYTLMESNQADKDNENTKKKKKGRKSIGPRKEKLGVAEIHEGIVGSLDLPSPSCDHIPMGTGKEESIKLNEGTDVEMKLLDASDHDAQEKVWELNRKEADSVQTQTAHTLENVSVGNKMMTEKTKSSVGDCHADSHTAETEYALMESNQADKDNENTKKKKKGRKSIGPRKEKLGVAEIHEGIVGSLDLPSPSHDHIPMATGKDESIKLNEGTDVEMKLLDASDHDAQEKIWEVSRKEADLVESQSEHTLKFKSSAGDCHEDFPTAETEHTVMESNQADKDNGNAKKKKMGRKSIGTKKENLGTTEIHNGIRGSSNLPSPSDDHIPKATGKDESIRINEGKNAQMKLLDASNHAAEANVLEVNRKEADLVESQTLENVSVLNKMMREKTQSSAGNRHADFPTAEPENTIMEFNPTNKDNENGESKYKKPTKKRRKQKHTATDVQPVKDQQVGIEAIATKEGRYVDTYQVLSCRNEGKVDEMHELVPNTDGLTENSKKGNEGINFRHQLQNKADSSDMVRKTAKMRRSSRIAKNNDVPSANIPTNLQNSVKSFEIKKSENNPYRESTVRTKCDSAHNSEQDEMSPNSVRKSSKTTEKQNGRLVLGQKVSGKPSSCKSSSERSETLHNRRGNALFGWKTSNMMLMKTPKKKFHWPNQEEFFRIIVVKVLGMIMEPCIQMIEPSIHQIVHRCQATQKGKVSSVRIPLAMGLLVQRQNLSQCSTFPPPRKW